MLFAESAQSGQFSARLAYTTREGDVYVKPPKEAGEKDSIVWKLNVCVYGLTDAPRSWYLSVKEYPKKMGANMILAFRWYVRNEKLAGIICAHVDDFLFGETDKFVREVIRPLKLYF